MWLNSIKGTARASARKEPPAPHGQRPRAQRTRLSSCRASWLAAPPAGLPPACHEAACAQPNHAQPHPPGVQAIPRSRSFGSSCVTQMPSRSPSPQADTGRRNICRLRAAGRQAGGGEQGQKRWVRQAVIYCFCAWDGTAGRAGAQHTRAELHAQPPHQLYCRQGPLASSQPLAGQSPPCSAPTCMLRTFFCSFSSGSSRVSFTRSEPRTTVPAASSQGGNSGERAELLGAELRRSRRARCACSGGQLVGLELRRRQPAMTCGLALSIR